MGDSTSSGTDWAQLLQLGDADLMAWYALTHSNQVAYNQAGLSIGTNAAGTYQATAGLSSLFLIGLIVVGLVLVTR